MVWAADLSVQKGRLSSWSHGYEESVRFQSQAVVVVQLGWHGWVSSDVALVAEKGREEKELQLGQVLTHASPLSLREDEHGASHVFVQGALLVQESLGVKDVRMMPNGWVVVGGPLVYEDDCVLGYGVAH